MIKARKILKKYRNEVENKNGWKLFMSHIQSTLSYNLNSCGEIIYLKSIPFIKIHCLNARMGYDYERCWAWRVVPNFDLFRKLNRRKTWAYQKIGWMGWYSGTEKFDYSNILIKKILKVYIQNYMKESCIVSRTTSSSCNFGWR